MTLIHLHLHNLITRFTNTSSACNAMPRGNQLINHPRHRFYHTNHFTLFLYFIPCVLFSSHGTFALGTAAQQPFSNLLLLLLPIYLSVPRTPTPGELRTLLSRTHYSERRSGHQSYTQLFRYNYPGINLLRGLSQGVLWAFGFGDLGGCVDEKMGRVSWDGKEGMEEHVRGLGIVYMRRYHLKTAQVRMR